jgi:hypothetical protein
VVRVQFYRPYSSRGPGSILERGPLSLVSAIEELLGRKSIGSGLENREYGRRGSVTLTTWHYPQKFALSSPKSGVRSVGIVRSRNQAMEFFFLQGGKLGQGGNEIDSSCQADLTCLQGQSNFARLYGVSSQNVQFSIFPQFS